MNTNKAMGAKSMLMSPDQKAKAQDKLERERLQLEKGGILRKGSWDSTSGVKKAVCQKRLSLDLKQTILSSTIKAQEELLLGDHDKEDLEGSKIKTANRMYNCNHNTMISLEQSIANTADLSSMDASLRLGGLLALTNIEAAELTTLQQYGISSTALSQLKVENKMLQISLKKASKELIANIAKGAEKTQSINPNLTAQQGNDLKALEVLSLNYLKSMQTLIMASVTHSPDKLVDEKNEVNQDGQKIGSMMKKQLAGLLSVEMLEGGMSRGTSLSCVQDVRVRDFVKSGMLHMDEALAEAELYNVSLEKPFYGCKTAEDVLETVEILAELKTSEGRPLLNMRSVLSALLGSIETHIQSKDGAIGPEGIIPGAGIEWGSHYMEGDDVALGETTLSDRVTRLHSSGTLALIRVLRAFVDTDAGSVDTLTALMKKPKEVAQEEAPVPSDEPDAIVPQDVPDKEVQDVKAVKEAPQERKHFDVSNFANLVRVGTDFFHNEGGIEKHNFFTNMPLQNIKSEIFSPENMAQFGELLLQPGLVVSLSMLKEKGLLSTEEQSEIARKFLEEVEKRWTQERLTLLQQYIPVGNEVFVSSSGNYKQSYAELSQLLNTNDESLLEDAFVYMLLKKMSA